MSKTLFIAIFLTFCGLSTNAEAKVFDAQTFFLPNGMQVVLVENHRAPVVSHMVWYNVGRANEDVGHSGLAHFFEHLMFKGTSSVPEGEFSKIIKRLGGNDNAFTSQDYTAYYQNIPVEHLGTAMKMEADRMVNLRVNDETVLTERDVIVEERKQRTDNNPSAILREEINTALYPNHPYRIPVIGWMSEIQSLTPESAKAFYKKWYAPNNAILVVAGDITLEKLRELAEKHYSTLPPSSIEDFVFPTPAPILADHTITYSDPRVGTPSTSMTYRAPRSNEALEVLIEAFGGTTTSPLYKSLVIEQKIAVHAGAYYTGSSKDISSVTVYAVPNPDVDLGTLEAALKAEISALLQDNISPEELNRAKKRLVNETVFERDSLQGPAMIIGRGLTSGETLDDIENWPETIKTVTIGQVASVRDEVFSGVNKPIIARLLPSRGENK